jgi:hypothetical protein
MATTGVLATEGRPAKYHEHHGKARAVRMIARAGLLAKERDPSKITNNKSITDKQQQQLTLTTAEQGYHQQK